MAERSGLVHEPEKARAHLRPAIPAERHEKALGACRDVPEMEPVFRLPLDQIGISSKTVWIDLPQGRLPFDAEIMVNLPGNFKGIHMSRMEKSISELFSKPFDDIRFYAERLCRLILPEQRGDRARISIRGKVPQIARTSISSESSVDSLTISVRTTGTKKEGRIETASTLGISVTHITACPCTQVYNRNLFPGADESCLPTHSQRCVVTLQIEDRRGGISFQELYTCLASCLHLTQDLLKRPDEAELVLKSHREPQFAEDVIRLAALETGKRLEKLLPGDSRVRLETVSYESIHLHNVKCRLECRLKDITDRLG